MSVDVLLATSWDATPLCGIAQHSAQLIEAVQAADPELRVHPAAAALDPLWVALSMYEILHLNYHRALHSRWTPEAVAHAKQQGRKVVITFHDTFGEHPPDPLTQALHDVADAFIVHEPCEGLPHQIYWRMGVPELDGGVGLWTDHRLARPILGTVGHDFPWKNWPLLCETAAQAGWGVLLCCPSMSDEREADLRTWNPWLTVRRGLSRQAVLRDLSVCDATAFLFTCQNSGQSASILQGIGARKPVIAFHTCRQMRSLRRDDLGLSVIHWVDTFEDVFQQLTHMRLSRFDTGIAALAHQESWTKVGQQYAGIYRLLV